jgi:hypothetical protein
MKSETIQYFKAPWEYKPLPDVTIKQLWQHVATIRQRNGDRQGAARARRNAKLSIVVKCKAGKRKMADQVVHYKAGAIVCNVANTRPVKTTSNVDMTTCHNCMHTHRWLFHKIRTVSCPDCLAYAHMNCWKVEGTETLTICFTDMHVSRVDKAIKEVNERGAKVVRPSQQRRGANGKVSAVRSA